TPPAAVKRDRVAPAAVPAGEHVADRLCVLLRRSAAQLLRGASRDSQFERVDLTLADAAVDDLANEVRARRRELVDAACPVDDEGAAGAGGGQNRGPRAHGVPRVE